MKITYPVVIFCIVIKGDATKKGASLLSHDAETYVGSYAIDDDRSGSIRQFLLERRLVDSAFADLERNPDHEELQAELSRFEWILHGYTRGLQRVADELLISVSRRSVDFTSRYFVGRMSFVHDDFQYLEVLHSWGIEPKSGR